MCGIACCYGPACHEESAFAALQEAVSSRGPDAQNIQKVELGEQALRLHSSVLHLRGSNITEQPFRRGPHVLAYVRSEDFAQNPK
jgi:asparagine synthetase B (glutamine-hydrolysing)